MYFKMVKRYTKTLIQALLYVTGFSAALIIIPNVVILLSTKDQISSDIQNIKTSDTGIVLGASVYSGGRVSRIVNDRIESAVRLYREGKVKHLLVTGDHRGKYYDEVSTIKLWLIKSKIPVEKIIMDDGGVSTYESIYRAARNHNIKKAIIITQRYHLPRALYIANRYGISAQGFVADQKSYTHVFWFYVREYLARVKDFFYTLFLNLDSFYPTAADK